jgi:hypothetical protein
MRHALAFTLVAATVVGGPACNRRVFEPVEPTCDPTIASDVDSCILLTNHQVAQQQRECLVFQFV